MYRTIADFTRDWAYERGATGKVLGALTEESLGVAVRPGGRTLGRLGWHIVETLTEMTGEAGLTVAGSSAGDLAGAYAEVSGRLGEVVAAEWTDGMLLEEVPMYGERWTRGQVLGALVKHEAHHRGQMTVLMRQAGLRVPGVYGPAEEEWGEMGMAAQG